MIRVRTDELFILINGKQTADVAFAVELAVRGN